MSFLNIFSLSISIICLLLSIFTFAKSIYVAIVRSVRIRNIHTDVIEIKDIASSVGQIKNAYADACLDNVSDICNLKLALVDLVSGRVVASTQKFPCIVGRSEPSDIIIDSDKAISRRHAVFTYENGNLFVSDLESTNGTLINGVRILSKLEVYNGAIMQIGQSQLKLIVNENL